MIIGSNHHGDDGIGRNSIKSIKNNNNNNNNNWFPNRI